MASPRSTRSVPRVPADLLEVLADISKPAELSALLGDLLTPAEVLAIGERWEIVKRLRAGATQREVAAELGVAIATVSRGAKQLRYGTGGFESALSRPRRRR